MGGDAAIAQCFMALTGAPARPAGTVPLTVARTLRLASAQPLQKVVQDHPVRIVHLGHARTPQRRL